MPFRLNEHRAKIQFITMMAMPNLIYQACVKTGVVSNTRYVQVAVCEALARDLDLDLDWLLDQLPEPKGPAKFLSDGSRHSQRATATPGSAQVAQGD